MATSERAKQKKLTKQKAKKAQVKKASAKKASNNLLNFVSDNMLSISKGPIRDCLMSEELFENGIGHMILSRRTITGDLAVATFLIDTFCLGVKDVLYSIMSPEDSRELISVIEDHEDLVSIGPPCFRKLIEDSIEYAKSNGISPHEDYKDASKIFGDIKAEDCSEVFEFGYEGKPLYVVGPNDSPQKQKKILNALTKAHGEGGFDYVHPGEMIDDDDMDDEDFIMPDRRGMEKFMARMTKLLNEQNFSSVEEANKFLQSYTHVDQLPEMENSSPLDKAQDLMYDAWGAKGNQRVKLAKQALAISEDCADAYVLLAEETAKDPKQAKDLYEKGVAAGERAIKAQFGEAIFEEDPDFFWNVMETRPYMRALEGLAISLWELEDHTKAIEIYQQMLKLNPNDNQGVRYVLASCLLKKERHEELEKLLEEYNEDASAEWAYSRALLAFRKEGDGKTSNSLLKAAIKSNRFVPDYLIGNKRMPTVPPAYMSHGDDSEAINYAVSGKTLWQDTPGAIEWLQTNIRK
jgi:tetratricopeptide (TPR) repeat protein